MKKYLLLIIGLIVSATILAQTPQGISHQAVIRDAQGELITNATIGIQVSILLGSMDGVAVYVERHEPESNSNGLITYVIGYGDAQEGSFETIDWGSGIYFLKTEVDVDGGTNYTLSGTTQLLSVPYALHAQSAEEYYETDPLFTEWDKSEGIAISEEQIVDLQDYIVEETDPVFLQSPAAAIEASDMLNWNEAFEWGSHNGLYLPVDWTPGWEDMPEGSASGEIWFWDGSQWQSVVPGLYNQTLRFCDGVPTWGDCPPTIPVVATSAILNITDISATSGGTVIEQGGANVTIRGLLWSTQPNPTLENNEGFATSGAGTGSFTINMTGLTPQTQYYVRAFAGNAAGVGYASQLTFTTEAPTAYPPAITTAPVTEITQTSAVSGGDVTDDGGASITAKGVVWNTISLPTVDNNAGMTNEGTGSDPFVSELSGLIPNTNYYLRAYAINSHGITYGSQKVFITLSDPALPTLITAEITDITPTSAISGGEITDAGEGEILLRGVCYSTSENPTVDDLITQDGEGTGSFTSELTNLESARTYYVRAFASSTAGGIGYGNQLSFTTPDGPPSLEITNVNNTQPGYTTIDAVVSHDGGQQVTERGFVWHIIGNPTLENNMGSIQAGSGTGGFSGDLVGLIPNTIHYVRAYATNDEDTGYSDQVKINFWDYHETVTDIDGNIYNTVMIGDQEWMVENLKTTKYSNGVPIEYLGDNINEWHFNTSGAFTWYDNDESWKNIYGALYNWFATINENSLCPAGWRMPTDEDWTELNLYLIGVMDNISDTNVGNALKSCRQVNSPFDNDCNTSEHPRWRSDETHFGKNEFGFSALPAGAHNYASHVSQVGNYGYWWSITEHAPSSVSSWIISSSDGALHGHGYFQKTEGFSVRCIRD